MGRKMMYVIMAGELKKLIHTERVADRLKPVTGSLT
jgi:hypothetical protein